MTTQTKAEADHAIYIARMALIIATGWPTDDNILTAVASTKPGRFGRLSPHLQELRDSLNDCTRRIQTVGVLFRCGSAPTRPVIMLYVDSVQIDGALGDVTAKGPFSIRMSAGPNGSDHKVMMDYVDGEFVGISPYTQP